MKDNNLKKNITMSSSPPRTIHGENLIMASMNSSRTSACSITFSDYDHDQDNDGINRITDDGACDNGSNSNSDNMSSNRPRVNSRDIVRSYSGLFGREGDMLGFELARNEHNENWLERGGFLLLGTYVGGICIFQLIVSAILDSCDNSTTTNLIPLYWSWTITNAVHCIVTLRHVHWLKGSMFDEHGDLAAMTLWEQIEGRSNTLMVKRTLAIVPTLLCYAACQFSKYSYVVCFANVVLWIILMMAKLPIMNGVRIFGINRTTGIDDNYNISASTATATTKNNNNTTRKNRNKADRRRRQQHLQSKQE